MKRMLVSLLLTLSASGVAQAADDTVVGDPAVGKDKVVNMAVIGGRPVICSTCHGPDGNSIAPMYARQAGQSERYLLKQMHDIKSGARTLPEMTGQLDPLSDQDMADIAAYFASQKRVTDTSNADAEKLARGKALYYGGKLSEGVPACSGCHGADGDGIASAGFPGLKNQYAQYVAKQLNAFRDGSRANDTEVAGAMRIVAGKLTAGEIDDLSQFIQGMK